MRERPIVVGAGAGGLAVAAVLRRRGVSCDVVEKAPTVGAAWAGRYDSLRLHTARGLSSLPGMAIPRSYGRWVARDDVVRYLTDYAAEQRIDVQLGVEVTRVERDGDGWLVRTSAGDRHAPVVVFATSASCRPWLPDWAVPGPTVAHSSSYRNPAGFKGRRVLVVGAGNSGSEIAVDLARAGVDVTMSVRRPPDILRRQLLGVPSQVLGIALRRVPERVMNPLGAALRRFTVPDLSAFGLPRPSGAPFSTFLETRTIPILDHGFVSEVHAGRIRIVPAVESLTGTTATLRDASTVNADAVICATGYRPGLEPIVGHLGVLDSRGRPLVHGSQTVPGVPGLHFCGISVELTGQLRELGIEARATAAAIV